MNAVLGCLLALVLGGCASAHDAYIAEQLRTLPVLEDRREYHCVPTRTGPFCGIRHIRNGVWWWEL
jgi:hypothetical protein